MTRHYLRQRLWVAALVLLGTLVSSAVIAIAALEAEAERSRYIATFDRLGIVAHRLADELGVLPVWTAGAEVRREQARAAFVELLTGFRAMVMSAGVQPNADATVRRLPSYHDHLDSLAADFAVDAATGSDWRGLEPGSMPGSLRRVWAADGTSVRTGTPLSLELALAQLLRHAAPIVRNEGALTPLERGVLSEVQTLATRHIGPKLAEMSHMLEQELDRNTNRAMGIVLLLSALGVGATLLNVFAIFRPLEHEVAAAHEALTVERDRALEAAAAKRNFLSMMSHELRTPMNGVLGFAGLLLASELRPEQRRQVEIIRSSGRTLLALVNDILDLARMEAGSLELAEEPFSLEEVIGEVLALGSAGAAQKGLETAVFIDPRLPAMLRGDRERVRQILTNLVGNAIKFTEQGAVTIEVSRLEAGRTGGVTFELAVSDTGPGIPADQQARVFDQFAQAEQAARHRSEGSGLGLAICRELVERMGGDIRLESTPGEGSTFRVRLDMQADVNVVEAETPAEDCDRAGAGTPWTQASEPPAHPGARRAIASG